MLTRVLRQLFFLVVVRPLMLIILGMNVRHIERLPRSGPAIVVANHNSHLDTLALMTLFPRRLLDVLRPVAAADYFLRNRVMAWFATRIVGIIPLARGDASLTPRAGSGRPTTPPAREDASLTPRAGSGRPNTPPARGDASLTPRAGSGRPTTPPARGGASLSAAERLGGIYEALELGCILLLFPEGSRGEPERLSEFRKGIAVICRKRPDVPVIPVFMHGLGKALPKGEGVLVPFFCDVFVGEPLPRFEGIGAFMGALDEAMRELASEGEFPDWT